MHKCFRVTQHTFWLSILFFPDSIATYFGPLSGHHQEIPTQMYHETIFYKGSVVSIGIKHSKYTFHCGIFSITFHLKCVLNSLLF
jgi:hypothetical protein